jgi:hypothetical protein
VAPKFTKPKPKSERMNSSGRVVQSRTARGRFGEKTYIGRGELAHHKLFNVVLLGDGFELVHDTADQVVAHLLGQGSVVFMRDHQVVECGVSGSGRVHAEDQNRARNGGGMRRPAMDG